MGEFSKQYFLCLPGSCLHDNIVSLRLNYLLVTRLLHRDTFIYSKVFFLRLGNTRYPSLLFLV